MLRDVAALYEPMAVQRDLSVTLHASAPVCVNGDVDLLFGAIEKLLDNMPKFTPRCGAITLETGIDAGLTALKIADTGPGIDIGEREAVLRSFDRGGGAASGLTSGHGLGLSLVAAIGRAHGVRVEIHDNRPGPGSVAVCCTAGADEPGEPEGWISACLINRDGDAVG